MTWQLCGTALRNWPVASTRECRGDWMRAAEPIDECKPQLPCVIE